MSCFVRVELHGATALEYDQFFNQLYALNAQFTRFITAGGMQSRLPSGLFYCSGPEHGNSILRTIDGIISKPRDVVVIPAAEAEVSATLTSVTVINKGPADSAVTEFLNRPEA